MRGIDPETDTLIAGDEARVRQAFQNMKLIAESEGATLGDAIRLVVYVTDNGVVTRATGDWNAIELTSHREVTIQVGTRITEIPNFTWSAM